MTPDTILRRHHRLVAAKRIFEAKTADARVGLMKKIAALAVRFAKENPTWGYNRVRGALKNVGHVVTPNTVKEALKAADFNPAHDRDKRTKWRTIVKARAASIAATDFFTTEVWTARGLVTHYTLFVIDLATRKVRIVGTTPNPNAVFMSQPARLLTDPVDAFLRAKRFLIMDRDSSFSADFLSVLMADGVQSVRKPASSPNCNSFAERFVGSVRRESTNRMIFVRAASLDRALAEYVAHCNAERNHQGIGNHLIAPTSTAGSLDGRLERREQLGGMLSYYHRRAA